MAHLTDKQSAFVDEYLVDMNASAAARRAGYSEKTAGYIGHENLKKPKIKEKLDERLKERRQRTEVTQDMVVEGLLQEARRDEEGSSHGARVSAWRALGKHLGLFVDRIEHTGIPDISVRFGGDPPPPDTEQ